MANSKKKEKMIGTWPIPKLLLSSFIGSCLLTFALQVMQIIHVWQDCTQRCNEYWRINFLHILSMTYSNIFCIIGNSLVLQACTEKRIGHDLGHSQAIL